MAETRLIDAIALGIDAEKSFHDWPVIRGDIDRMINRQPTIDPESLRPKGRWAKRQANVGEETYCTACGEEAEIIQDGGGCELLSDYCPKCGAKMEV